MLRRQTEASVEAGEFHVLRPVLAGYQGRGQLERVGGAQRVQARQALRKLAHIIQGLNFMPGRLQRGELPECLSGIRGRKLLLAFQSRECGCAFDGAAPPDHHIRVGRIVGKHIGRRGFLDQKRQDGGTVPESRLVVSRASSRAARRSFLSQAWGGHQAALFAIAAADYALTFQRRELDGGFRSALGADGEAWPPADHDR